MMVIGIDASQANREVRSGTEWYAFYLLQEFKKILGKRKDLAVRLYTRGTLQNDLANDLPENFEVKILRWPLRYFWGQLRLSWEMFVNPPDILFCPAHTIPLVHPKKTLTTLHDIGFEDYPELYDWRSRVYHQWSAKLAVKKAFHLFTVSEFSKERIIEVYDCPEQKITVTHLGFDKNKFRQLGKPEVESVLRNYKLLYKNYFFYLGRLEPKKNILNLLKAYESFRKEFFNSPDLVLAGRQVAIQNVLEYLKVHADLQNHVRFLDYIKEQDKPALYNGAAIFCFPTLYEGFGLPILEAQACATPVVTSNTASNPEIAGKGGLLADPGSPWAIAENLKRLMVDEQLRRQTVAAGLENVQRFDWAATARETLEKIL